jgi:hypothetical protein
MNKLLLQNNRDIIRDIMCDMNKPLPQKLVLLLYIIHDMNKPLPQKLVLLLYIDTLDKL